MLPKISTDDLTKECKRSTPHRIVEQIAELRRIAAEAIAKIDEEGSVVRTLKGDVIAHPAIKIHADAIKNEAALLKQWAQTRAF